MPTYRITAPDGTTYDVTGNGSADDALAHVRSLHAPPAAAAPKDDSAARGFALGAEKPLDNLTSAAMQIPGVAAIDKFGQRLGFPSASRAVSANDSARANNSRTGYQLLGNIAGTVPTLALPGGALAQGAAGGALVSDAKDAGGIAKDAAIGMITGKVGDVLGKVASNVIAPKVSGAVRKLADIGVPLTPGQAFGGVARGIEDRLTGLPIVGDIVNNARGRGIEKFNRVIIDKALTPLGMKLPDKIATGREAVAYLADATSAAYNKLVPKLTATPDAPFVSALQRIETEAAALPGSGGRDFKSIVGKDVLAQLRQGTTLTGEGLKTLESRLSRLAGKLNASSDAYQQMTGDTVSGLLDEVRALVMRSNPAHAKELKAINRAFAEQVRVERAAGAAGNADGVMTPKGYAAAVRGADGSSRRSAVARGRALNQDVSDAAADVLPNSVPDSGTAGRAGMATLGMMAAGGGGVLAGISPLAIAGGMAAAGAYSKAGQKALARLLQTPGPIRAGVARNIERATPLGRVGSVPLVVAGSK